MKIKFLTLLIAPLLFIACTPDVSEDNFKYQQPEYHLVFESSAPVQWTVNGVEGTAKKINVSQYAEVKVKVSMESAASLTCVLEKGKYPVEYYVVSCYPHKEYEFVMKVKE